MPYTKVQYEQRKKDGLCPYCAGKPDDGFVTCSKCREYQSTYRKRHRPQIKAYRNKKAQETGREQIRASHKRWRDDLKKEVIEHYGGECACCGESVLIFLTIDHVEGNGAKHRLLIFGTRLRAGVPFYGWLKRNRFPAGFQVLCWNCNAAKHIMGVCPHQRKR